MNRDVKPVPCAAGLWAAVDSYGMVDLELIHCVVFTQRANGVCATCWAIASPKARARVDEVYPYWLRYDPQRVDRDQRDALRNLGECVRLACSQGRLF